MGGAPVTASASTGRRKSKPRIRATGGKRRKRITPLASVAIPLALVASEPSTKVLRTQCVKVCADAKDAQATFIDALDELVPLVEPSSSAELLPATVHTIKLLKTLLAVLDDGPPGFNTYELSSLASATLVVAKTAIVAARGDEPHASDGEVVESAVPTSSFTALKAQLSRLRTCACATVDNFGMHVASALQRAVINAVNAAGTNPLVETVSLSVCGGKKSVVPNPLEMVFHVAPASEPSTYRDYAELFLIPLDTLNGDEYVRQEVMFEFVSSEVQFVTDLELLINVFAHPLRELPEVLESEMTASIFANVDDLLTLHTALLADLQARQLSAPTVGAIADILVPHIRALAAAYSEYCGNHPRSISNLKRACLGRTGSKLRRFLDEVGDLTPLRRLPLEGYLVKPVQRLCKYPLLLRELIKATPPEAPGLELLSKAHALLDALVQRVNDNKRVADEQRRLEQLLDAIDGSDSLLLSAAPCVIQDGLLVKRTGSKTEERLMVVLDSTLLWAKKSLVGRKTYSMRKHFPLSAVLVEDMKDTPTLANVFRLRTAEKEYVWEAPSHKVKIEWILNISEARNKFLARHNMLPLSAPPSSSGPS
ncbi:uncharacterized protein AMSG_04932 [Thecamonas trahens ATCC 50062]|uniref:DH domain-containing protein n=1 Tax=Thecamonas trahens ATCC 50062 TaxID=461836 RepID=A0A0L0DB10_THETB|nr:hypothetical protein AMSG_04932 [Thecamonas trahens ATCC 50062]KNC48483.1 hypothetical protein AMSG_04932 [Thecamonas trahens ATCC 50062]|eukprot:XP_013758596.1 hypothetical protein AMSG_04932 [Thecamonas trahens ATCC 50062]